MRARLLGYRVVLLREGGPPQPYCQSDGLLDLATRLHQELRESKVLRARRTDVRIELVLAGEKWADGPDYLPLTVGDLAEARGLTEAWKDWLLQFIKD